MQFLYYIALLSFLVMSASFYQNTNRQRDEKPKLILNVENGVSKTPSKYKVKKLEKQMHENMTEGAKSVVYGQMRNGGELGNIAIGQLT